MIAQVSIKSTNGCGVANWQTLSVKEYKSLPLSDRLNLIQEKAIQFFDETGASIDATKALKELKAA